MWLNKLLKYFEDKTLIATSASYESLYTSLKLKKFNKIFSYFKKNLIIKEVLSFSKSSYKDS